MITVAQRMGEGEQKYPLSHLGKKCGKIICPYTSQSSNYTPRDIPWGNAPSLA